MLKENLKKILSNVCQDNLYEIEDFLLSITEKTDANKMSDLILELMLFKQHLEEVGENKKFPYSFEFPAILYSILLICDHRETISKIFEIEDAFSESEIK